MAGSGPTILVVDGEREECGAIAAALREAGFVVAAAADDRAARAVMMRQRFAAAVIALPNGGVEFLRRARRRQPGLPALLVVEPVAQRLVDADATAFITRPFDPRELLARAIELVLHEAEHRGPDHSHAAELGIAAAQLACLHSRRAAAAAAGATRLAQDLTRQIAEAAAIAIDDLAAD
jgi:DNA-binding response OmpR family regulator